MSRENTIPILGISIISIVIVLSGCNGGGDGYSGYSDDSVIHTDAITSGKAAKGIIQNGIVTAQELSADGIAIREVGSAITDLDGDYSLNISDGYEGGVIRLTLSSDGINTIMICDVQPGCDGTDFGETLKLSSSFTMLALLPSVRDGEEVSAQITPFSHMAASRVAGGFEGFTADAVKRATSEINQMVGLNVLYTSPVDITKKAAVESSSASELIYSVFAAGIGNLLFDSNDLETGMHELADTFTDGLFDSDDPIRIADIMESVEQQAAASAIDPIELIQVLATLRAQLKDLDGDGFRDYDPEPADAATLPAVEQARDLVSQVRNHAGSIDVLEAPANAFYTERELMRTLATGNTQALIELVGVVAGTVLHQLTEGWLDLEMENTVTILGATGMPIGDVIVTPSNHNGLTISIVGDDLSGVTLDLSLENKVATESAFGNATFLTSPLEFTIHGSLNNDMGSIEFTAADFSIDYADAVKPGDFRVSQKQTTDSTLVLTACEFNSLMATNQTIAADTIIITDEPCTGDNATTDINDAGAVTITSDQGQSTEVTLGTFSDIEASVGLTDINNNQNGMLIQAGEATPIVVNEAPINLDIGLVFDSTLTDKLPTKMNLDGNIAITDFGSGATFTGSSEIELVQLFPSQPGVTVSIPLSLSEMGLSGEFSDHSITFDANMQLILDDTRGLDSLAFLTGSYVLRINESQVGDTFGFVDNVQDIFGVDPATTSIDWLRYGPVAGGNCGAGTDHNAGEQAQRCSANDDETCIGVTGSDMGEPVEYCLSGDVFHIQDYLLEWYPDALEVSVSFAEYDTSTDTTSIRGQATYQLFETVDSHIQGTLTATLEAALPESPTTTVVLTVDHAGGLDGENAIFSLITGGSSISYRTVTNRKDSGGIVPYLSQVMVTDPDGVALVISKAKKTGSLTGELTVNGVEVGSIEQADPGQVMIHYIDGTFEAMY